MSARYASIDAFRNDPFNWPLAVEGHDLTGATIQFTVRNHPDDTGSALATASVGAGITLVDVLEDDDGVKTSLIQITVAKATIQAFPTPDEALSPIGADMPFYYDLQWTLATPEVEPFTPVEETKLYGTFILRGSIND